jgi:hypothetical protein
MAKINVHFNDSEDSTINDLTQKKDVEDSTNSTNQKIINTAVATIGKRILSTGASQIGNMTGNYILQSQINNAISIVGYAGTIAVGGWVGLATVVTDIGIKSLTYDIDLRKANAQANYLAQVRGGILNDNSR